VGLERIGVYFFFEPAASFLQGFAVASKGLTKNLCSNHSATGQRIRFELLPDARGVLPRNISR